MGEPFCYFCQATVDEACFCHGCRQYICDSCNLRFDGMGAHIPIDHLVADEEFGDDDAEEEG